jgi:hypothetical protein
MPNPSLKRSANGRPPGPVWRSRYVCDVHDIKVDGVSPLVKTGGVGGVAKEARISS